VRAPLCRRQRVEACIKARRLRSRLSGVSLCLLQRIAVRSASPAAAPPPISSSLPCTSCTGACGNALGIQRVASIHGPAPHVIRRHQSATQIRPYPTRRRERGGKTGCTIHAKLQAARSGGEFVDQARAAQAIIQPGHVASQASRRNACPSAGPLVAAAAEVLVKCCLHPAVRRIDLLRRRNSSFMVPGSRPIIGSPESGSRSNGPQL